MLKPVVVTPATGSDPEVMEDRLCVTLAQLTYNELQTVQLRDMVDELVLTTLGV